MTVAYATDGKVSETGYVGTLVGESTSTEFRLALAAESVREQDIVAVDVELAPPGGANGAPEKLRVWAKVKRIERINPLFPAEAGHELAATRTDPFDTVLSLSREMVSAVCQVLGSEPLDNPIRGKLQHLRYPPRPATSAYQPSNEDIARVVAGELKANQKRALDLATLSNRPDVNVYINGHAVVTRHLAILAMTGAGKSWTARRLIEQLAARQYPIVIFDPHGDYSGLAEVPALRGRVRRFHASFPIFDQEPDAVSAVIESLSGWELAPTHRAHFDMLFRAARTFVSASGKELDERARWLDNYRGRDDCARFGLSPDLFALKNVIEALVIANRNDDSEALEQLVEWTGIKDIQVGKQTARNLEHLPIRLFRAARALQQAETISRRAAGASDPLPSVRASIVAPGQISVVSLSGYAGDLRVALYDLIAGDVFSARVEDNLKLPVLLLLEEAHNFAPAPASTSAERRAVNSTRQIAQEGRKFGVGLVLISQRPSRLDETTLSQCNSYIIMRMANPADQNYVRRSVETLGEDEARMLPDLDVGEALLTGQFVNFPVLARIKAPESRGEREEEDAFEALPAAFAAHRAQQTAMRR